MNRRKLLVPTVLAAALFHAGSAWGGARITIVNADAGTGQGFEDATPVAPVGGNPGTTRGEQALIVFQFAADLLGSVLESDVEILNEASFQALSCTATGGVLGSSGTNYIFAFNPGPTLPEGAIADTWYHSALGDALAGIDLGSANGLPVDTPDIISRFNGRLGQPGCLTGSGWYFGLDGNTPSNLINFLDVVVHEMSHGLGFSGFNTLSTGAQFQGRQDIYSTFVIDNSTGTAWTAMTNAQRQAAAVNDSHLVFTGATVKDEAPLALTAGVDGDGNVQLYAPTVLAQGSSFSHYDTRLTPNALMEPFINDNLLAALHLDLTPALFSDIGWQINRGSQFLLGCDTGVPTSVAGGPIIGANLYGTARATAGGTGDVDVYRSAIRAYVDGLADDGLLTPAQHASASACLDDEQTALQFEEWGGEPGPDPSDAIPLANGVAVAGLSGAAGSEVMYSITVPGGASGPLSITTTGGSGDVSVLVSYEAVPTVEDSDYRSERPGNNETVRVNAPSAGTYYIKLVGVRAYSNVRLTARHN